MNEPSSAPMPKTVQMMFPMVENPEPQLPTSTITQSYSTGTTPMLKSLHIENLKGFKTYDIDFSRINVLVGGNNSGKTTVFHALNLFFLCLQQTANDANGTVTLNKTQVPELGAIPYFNMRDLFFQQRIRTGRQPTKIKITLKTSVAPALDFTIYPAFSRNLMIDGGKQTISSVEYEAIKQLSPIYVPGTIGITVREELYREVAQERMILEGRQNQVLRNLVYRLKKKPDEWRDFIEMVKPLFSLEGLDVPFDDVRDEWLTATYNDSGCSYDFVSAGSGFLQVINLLSFLCLHTSRVALLDEPDSHMHDDLQRLTFDLLDRLSQKRNIQLIIATHSPTLIDAAGLEHVLLIDRTSPKPLQAQNVEALVPLLGDRGLSIPPTKIMNTLKARRVLFVEGSEDDYEYFILQYGEAYKSGFKTATRGLTVIETGGATKQWPFDAIDCFIQLIGVNLAYLYISDRDFFTDVEITQRLERSRQDGKSIAHMTRRHRESYLVIPDVIARVIEKKWKAKHPNDPIPPEVSAEGIHRFVLEKAKENEETIRTDLLVQHEPSLRGTDEHRKEETEKLLIYFQEVYVQTLARGDIPYKLLDCKKILKNIRTYINEQTHFSFSDKDILDCITPTDIPPDLAAVLDQILSLCPIPNQISIRPPAESSSPPFDSSQDNEGRSKEEEAE